MLRLRNSIIFVQQLEEDLEKADDKEYLTVIDFIGIIKIIHDTNCTVWRSVL